MFISNWQFIYLSLIQNSKIDPKKTIYVDAFLYDDERFDQLCEDGKLSRNYCTNCGSRDVKPLSKWQVFCGHRHGYIMCN